MSTRKATASQRRFPQMASSSANRDVSAAMTQLVARGRHARFDGVLGPIEAVRAIAYARLATAEDADASAETTQGPRRKGCRKP